jgi:hypothetical protein
VVDTEEAPEGHVPSVGALPPAAARLDQLQVVGVVLCQDQGHRSEQERARGTGWVFGWLRWVGRGRLVAVDWLVPEGAKDLHVGRHPVPGLA